MITTITLKTTEKPYRPSQEHEEAVESVGFYHQGDKQILWVINKIPQLNEHSSLGLDCDEIVAYEMQFLGCKHVNWECLEDNSVKYIYKYQEVRKN